MYPKVHFYLFLILVLLCGNTTYSQLQEVFDYSPITKDDNTYLCSNILTDHNGFVWYATKDWLVKDFGNSKKYIPLKFSKKSNLPALVDALFQDKDANIWVLTSLGIYIINYDDYSVTLLQPNIIENNSRYQTYLSIVQQQNGTIWVSTYQNYILEFKNNKLINDYKVEDKTTYFFSLSLNKNDEVILIGENKIFTIKNSKLEFVATKTPKDVLLSLKSPENEAINKTGFIQYKDKRIPYTYLPNIDMYKVSYKGWHIKNRVENRPKNLSFFVKDNRISTIYKNHLWVQQFEYKNQQWYLKDVFKIKLKANIHSISQDPFNNYILSSNANQIHKVRQNQKFYDVYLKDSLRNISTRAIISDAENNLFIASSAGTFKIDAFGNTSNISENAHDTNIYSFLRKNDSLVWDSSGFMLREDHFLKNTSRILEKKIKDHISAIKNLAYKDSTHIWIGTNDGLYLFDVKKESFINHNKLNDTYSLKDILINVVLQLPNNNVWFGSSNGAYLYNTKTKKVIHYSNKSKTHKIPHSNVLDIHQDKFNTVWMAGNKGLISISDKGEIKDYLTINGLVNNIACSILETTNYLWVATYGGISKISLSENTRQFSNYLKGIEFNHGSRCKLNDSTLLFGSTNGVYKIHTNKVSKKSHLSQKIVPVSLKTYQKDKVSAIEQFNIRNLKSIKLEHNTNFFEFKFALTKSFNHTKNDFLYKIEGLTNSWISIDNAIIIRQYGIPPGKYILRIKAINEEGMKSANEISIPITVSQIFYKTTGFILGVLLLILASILLAFFRIKRRYEKENKFKVDISELKIQVLKMRMNPHFIFNIINNIQSDLILKSTENINDYIHAFSSLLRTTMNMTNYNSISLKNKIDYLEAYIKLQEYRLNNSFYHKIEVINLTHNLDLETIKIPCMLLQPFVENAILHGLEPKEDSNKLLKITFTISEILEVIIEDNGVGRKKDENNLSNEDEPHAMGLMKTHVNLRNEFKKNKITYQVIDLVNDNNTPIGTKVVFKIPYE